MGNPVRLEHLAAFGAIVHQFARFEMLMASLAAQLIGARMMHSLILMTGLGYAGKRAALLSILEHHSLPDDQKRQITSFLDKLHAYNQMRNNIAHSAWMQGRRKGSIKPATVIVRGGTGRALGLDHNEPDYTLDQFHQAAWALAGLYNEFLDYLEPRDLLTPVIEEKTRAKKSSTSKRPGKPSSR